MFIDENIVMRGFTLLLPLVACLSLSPTADAHICILKQRLHPSTGKEQWSLPSRERCYCLGVLAPKFLSLSCPSIHKQFANDGDIWFTDNPVPLTIKTNWTKKKLDYLLEREVLCDIEKPVILNMPVNITEITDSGSPKAVVTWTQPKASDNIGPQMLTSSHKSGDSFPIGVTLVTYTSIDAAGNVETKMFTITIEDIEKPVILNIPINITGSTDSGSPNSFVTWTPPTASDNSGSQSLTSSHNSGDSFPIGVTFVTYTSMDAAGNVETQVFTITIEDIEKPVISNMPFNITRSTDSGSPNAVVTWDQPTASDNFGFQTLTSSHISGDSFPIGVTFVTYTSIDAAGNVETQLFIITIEDIEKPVISNIPINITGSTDNGSANAEVTWTPITASDNSGSQTLTSSHNSWDSFPIGVSLVTYTSTDAAGNVETIMFTISIEDMEKPVILNMPENITKTTDSGSLNAVVTWAPPTASDNSGSQTLTSSHNSGYSFPIGVTLVTYTSIDTARNEETKMFTIHIKAPVASSSSCIGRCEGSDYNYVSSECYCDKVCVSQGDCCVDYGSECVP